jgi:hypothetical protein
MALIQEKQAEPPAWLRPPVFMLGQDLRGNWVVQEQKGARGGLFVDRAAALRFIRAETGHKPQGIVMVSGILELDIACNVGAPIRRADGGHTPELRRIA